MPGGTIILGDDGIATSATVRAAVITRAFAQPLAVCKPGSAAMELADRFFFGRWFASTIAV